MSAAGWTTDAAINNRVGISHVALLSSTQCGWPQPEALWVHGMGYVVALAFNCLKYACGILNVPLYQPPVKSFDGRGSTGAFPSIEGPAKCARICQRAARIGAAPSVHWTPFTAAADGDEAWTSTDASCPETPNASCNSNFSSAIATRARAPVACNRRAGPTECLRNSSTRAEPPSTDTTTDSCDAHVPTEPVVGKSSLTCQCWSWAASSKPMDSSTARVTLSCMGFGLNRNIKPSSPSMEWVPSTLPTLGPGSVGIHSVLRSLGKLESVHFSQS
mmetsp:Transcript_4493/g.12357  ORF Transcript_4493/g.12357 Transcript_4493/m.12357 type:complete len:275 (-) Transcript_4493:641-1465(-)